MTALVQPAPRRASGAAGFSLIEVLAAMGITGFVIAGIAALFFRAIEQGELTRDDTRMTVVASNQIEELRRMYWSRSGTPPAAWATENAWLPSGTTTYFTKVGEGSPLYAYRYQIRRPVAYTPYGRQIIVEVWRHGKSNRKIRLVQVHGCAGCS